MIRRSIFSALVLGLLLSSPLARSAEPEANSEKNAALVLKTETQTVKLSRSELLKRSDASALRIEHHPSFDNQPQDYAHAVPLRALFKDLKIAADAQIQFECLDGFSASLSKDRLLTDSPDAAIPYLAIQAPGETWPAAHGNKATGPFFLVWKSPEKSKIGPEEWPFALAGFTIKSSLQSSSPKIFPAPGLPQNSPIQAGFKIFVKNCFACHTLNLEGQSKMGPDLNVPMSPAEYFTESTFKKLVRNPQNLRRWPESKMSAFPPDVISDPEITQLFAYLKHMSKNKVDR